MTELELERLRKIEKLAWDAVKKTSPQLHEAALAALKAALAENASLTAQELRKGAVTLRIIEPTDE